MRGQDEAHENQEHTQAGRISHKHPRQRNPWPGQPGGQAPRGTKSPIYPEMVMHEQRWGVKSSRDQVYPVGDPGEEYRAGVCCFCNFSGSEKCIKTKLPKKKLNARNY